MHAVGFYLNRESGFGSWIFRSIWDNQIVLDFIRNVSSFHTPSA